MGPKASLALPPAPLPLLLLACLCASLSRGVCHPVALPAVLPNYDMDGKQELEMEPWADMVPAEERAELEQMAAYYEQDTRSIIANLLSDVADMDVESEVQDDELTTAVAVNSKAASVGGLLPNESRMQQERMETTVKLTCSSSSLKSRVNQATAAIDGAVALLKKASDAGGPAAKAAKLLKWMAKWLNDVAAFLKARNFAKASKKLVAVTNNLASARKLASKAAAGHIQGAIPLVKTVKATIDSLLRCTRQAPLTVQSLPTAPSIQVPNPTPYSGMQGLKNPANAKIDGPDFDLTVNSKADSVRIKSVNTFTSGVFTVSYKCPSTFGGLITGIYLSSVDEYGKGDGILYEVLGKRPDRVRVGIMVSGSVVYAPAIDLGVDCSKAFHQYTIIWEANTVRWLFDGELLRHMDRNDPNARYTWFAASNMQFQAAIRRYYGAESAVGKYEPTKAPFVARFTELKITSPVGAQNMPAIPFWPRASWPLSKFGIDYSRDSVTRFTATNEVVLPFDPKQKWGGGRIVSPKRFDFGEFSAQIQCPRGNASGLVTSFYLSSMEGGSPFLIQDEIDFEFLGKNHRAVQFTYYVSGKAIHAVTVPLGFDCSTGFHLYTLRWTSSQIQWFVDNQMKHVALNDGVTPFPNKPLYLYASVWNADNGWAGKYFGADAPYLARYRNINVTSPLS